MSNQQFRDIAQVKAIEKKNKELLLKLFPNLNDNSGIYIMTRYENDLKFCYVGQAKHILTRLAQHLTGFQWIDLSIKKHKLYSEENQTGWKIGQIEYPISELDIMEQYWIKKYANAGYQLRNLTTGSQGTEKQVIDYGKSTKNYSQGVEYGYLKARREIAHLFDLHLDYSIKGEKTSVNKEKALEKFKNFISIEKN